MGTFEWTFLGALSCFNRQMPDLYAFCFPALVLYDPSPLFSKLFSLQCMFVSVKEHHFLSSFPVFESLNALDAVITIRVWRTWGWAFGIMSFFLPGLSFGRPVIHQIGSSSVHYFFPPAFCMVCSSKMCFYFSELTPKPGCRRSHGAGIAKVDAEKPSSLPVLTDGMLHLPAASSFETQNEITDF